MLAVVAVAALGIFWWTREGSTPTPPVVPIPQTITERWKRDLTDKAFTIIRTCDDRPCIGKPIPKRQILCSVVKPESWDEVMKKFQSFCEDISTSDPEARQVANWAASVLKRIQKMNELNEERRALRDDGQFWNAEMHRQKIQKRVDNLAKLLTQQLEATQDAEGEVYKEYSKLLRNLSRTNYWSALLTFLSSGSSMSETDPQILVNSSTRETDEDTSEEEHLKSLVQNETTRNMIATGVIEATGQREMVKTERFGSNIVSFSTGFTHRVEAPESPRGRGKAFRDALARTTQEVNQDAMTRTKARTTWPRREGQATWSEVSTTSTPVRRMRPDPLLQEMDRFLASVK